MIGNRYSFLMSKIQQLFLLSVVVFCFFCSICNAANPVTKDITKASNVAKKVVTAPAKANANVKKVATNAKKTVADAKKTVAKQVKSEVKKPTFKLPGLTKSTLSYKPTVKKVQAKKKVKTKQVVIDCKIVAFARTASDAEAAADALAVSMSSGKIKPLIKDSTFMSDTTGRIACLKRMNYTDKIPDNWYLETQMVVGFSSRSYEQAYNNALQRSAQKVKSIVEKSKVNDKISDTKKTPSAQKVIVYDYAFAKSGKEYYCRLFFRYMLPKN